MPNRFLPSQTKNHELLTKIKSWFNFKVKTECGRNSFKQFQNKVGSR